MAAQRPRIIHTKAKLRTPPLTINWGKGRLLPYESNVSFFAKFCLLNGLTPGDARRFLDKQCSYTWSPQGFSNGGQDKLARLLDEDKKWVKLLDRYELDLITCFGCPKEGVYLDELLAKQSLLYQFRYCPECIKSGYHASFHEYFWLQKCPLHPHLKLILKQQFPHRNFVTYCLYIKDFIETVRSHCPHWLAIEKSNPIRSKFLEGNFVCFSNWVKTVQDRATSINEACLFSTNGVEYSEENLQELISRINWLCPIPASISRILITQPRILKPLELTKLNQPTVPEFQRITAQIPYAELRSFYSKHMAMKGRSPPFRTRAREVLEKLNRHFEECRCDWRMDPNGHWWKRKLPFTYYEKRRRRAISVSSSALYACPFELVRETLKLDWFDFTDNVSSRSRYEYWQQYVRLALSLQAQGHLSVSNASLPLKFLKPIGRLCFTSDFLKFLEEIMRMEFNDWVQEVAYWLGQIEEGTPPFETKQSVPRLQLLHDGSTNYLIRWPFH